MNPLDLISSSLTKTLLLPYYIAGSENAAGGAGGAGMQLRSLHAAIPLSQFFFIQFLTFPLLAHSYLAL